jgi:hypothetical protein
MLIRYFVPLAVAVIALLCVGATKVGVPAPPVGIIGTVAACMMLVQLEDHKLGDFLSQLIRAFKEEHHA